MKSPSRTRSRGEKEKRNRKTWIIKSSKKPGTPNSPNSKAEKMTIKNLEKICIARTLRTSNAKWKKKNRKENKSWSKKCSLTRRPKLATKITKGSSRAMLRSAWKSGRQTARIYTRSSSTFLRPWNRVGDLALFNLYLLLSIKSSIMNQLKRTVTCFFRGG